MARIARHREDDEVVRATVQAHEGQVRQEFRAGLVAVAVFAVGLAIIFGVGSPS